MRIALLTLLASGLFAYFWRRIPIQLAERCQQLASPEMPAIEAQRAAWNVRFADTAQLIDSLLPHYAGLLGPAPEEAQRAIEAEVTRVIDAQYFDPKGPPGEACRKYGKILEWLGQPGLVAATRGYAYHVEAELARRERRTPEK